MKKQTQILTLILALFLLLFAAACNSGSDTGNIELDSTTTTTDENSDMDMTIDEQSSMDMTGDEHEHDENMSEAMPIPNDGAIIEIVSPADGDTFSSDDSIVVEVTFTNFVVGENGNHWHVAVDGTSFGMVTGTASDTILRGLEPGDHTISVNMANGDHQDLEDGDAITITVK